MEHKPNTKVSVAISALSALLAFAGLGWMTVSFMVGKLSVPAAELISEIGVTVFSALFVGAAASMIVNSYLKRVTNTGPGTPLRQVGVEDIYVSREDAASQFLRLIQDGKVRKLDIMGISLRGFLIGGGSLHEVWQAVRRRLQNEESKPNFPERQRLRVRLLLLDPKSGEGRFRASVEADTIGSVGLKFDVPSGLAEVSGAQQSIYQLRNPPYLQARLYEHCPFSFMFITEPVALIEQYYYRDHTKGIALPLVQYTNRAPQFGELVNSFDEIWKKAGPGELLDHRVGTAAAIEEARISNIYRKHERHHLGKRQIECIESAKPGDVIKVMAISGRFYTAGTPLLSLRRIASAQGGATVRFALIDPVCQQAILRAAADGTSSTDGLKEVLCQLTWEDHTSSHLYQDTHASINTIKHWKTLGDSFELRLFFGAVSCALLLTPIAAFDEPYFYGRGQEAREAIILGGEFPVFEFAVPGPTEQDKIEMEILSSTFDVVWNSYSITLAHFETRDERKEFDRNLAALVASCRVDPTADPSAEPIA